jgi:uncharacterized protein (TIGR02466 family)|tara:strand:+ start:7801 stop:8427 length:627 start_codon:yes stop_codon:yes gene_type:complete
MKQIMHKIEPLFSIPLYSAMLDRNLTEQENVFVAQQTGNVVKNRGGNYMSFNNNILESKELEELHGFFLEHINNYFNQIVNTNNKITPYITQSWLNYNNKNTFHHVHSHPNSYISGVFYIDSNIDNDSIEFMIDDHAITFSEIKDFNMYNSTHWTIPVTTGKLLLFPSNLKHCVKNHTQDYLRISLSFNVFVKGTIGSNLTQLKIMEG